MPFYVHGLPHVRVEQLPATEEAAQELLEFYAQAWEGWYNGELDAQMDVSHIADPVNADHRTRELKSLQSSQTTHVVARDEQQGDAIVGLAWLIRRGTSTALEEWNTYPAPYRKQGIGAAVLALALFGDRPISGRLSLEVYKESPVANFYRDVWKLPVMKEVQYEHVGSGVPQLALSGSDAHMRQWLRRQPRLQFVEN